MNSKEKNSGEIVTDIQSANLEDRFLFAQVMSDEEIAKEFLELVLHVKIRSVNRVEAEKEIENLYRGRGVRLDVFLESDEEQSIYDVEMQRKNQGNLPKRSRYYQGSMDAEELKKGADFGMLRRNYVIFLCTFDPFRKNRMVYTFQNLCMEDNSLSLGDETVKIFLNTRGDEEGCDQRLVHFLHYVEHSTEAEAGDDAFLQKIHKRVSEVKEDENMSMAYIAWKMNERDILEEGRQEGKEEGRQEGKAEGRREGKEEGARQEKLALAEKMNKEGIAADVIERVTGLSADVIDDLKKK